MALQLFRKVATLGDGCWLLIKGRNTEKVVRSRGLCKNVFLEEYKGHTRKERRENVLKVMIVRVFSPGVLRSKDFFDPIFVVLCNF